MPEMADTRQDDFLCNRDVGRRADPFDLVAAFFDRIDEGADVAGDVVEEVDCGHCGLVAPSGAEFLVADLAGYDYLLNMRLHNTCRWIFGVR